MKSLFAVLATAFFVSTALSCCSEDIITPLVTDATNGAQEDTITADASVSTEDVPVSTDEALDGDGGGQPTPEESDEQEELPSDPTEFPGEEASYYEFPAWHIPPQG